LTPGSVVPVVPVGPSIPVAPSAGSTGGTTSSLSGMSIGETPPLEDDELVLSGRIGAFGQMPP
jgi:hypothetical protein